MANKRDSAQAKAPKKAGGKAAADPSNAGRLRQIAMVAGLIRKHDPKALPFTIGSGVAIIAIFVIVGLIVNLLAMLVPLGVMLGLLASMLLFGRYAQAAQYAAIAGQPGAAVAIIQSMRGEWDVTPAVAGNRNMDVVHRLIARCGVVLIGEGSPSGLGSLLAAEKKRIGRIAYGVQITEFQVGEQDGQIPISKLERKLRSLPRALKAGDVSDLINRMKTLPSALQAPRGPMPKTGRMPRPPRPRVR